MFQLLAIEWGVVGIKVAQLLLALSILVVLHEFGHYITAKWFGCRVERFFLFFDPWFALFKKKIGETVYGVGWLPLGGYVKIAGMIDESMDRDQLKQPAEPWEFRSKPAWQRLIIMSGGVIVNVILAFIIYAGIAMVWGERIIPNDSVKAGIAIQDPVLYEIGLRDGDRVLAVDGETIEDFGDVTRKILVGKQILVERNGKQETIVIPVDFIGTLVEKKNSRNSLLTQRTPVIVWEAPDSLEAYKAGIRNGDRIVAINQTPTPYFDLVEDILKKSEGDSVQLTVERNGGQLVMAAKLSAERKLGFYNIAADNDLVAAGVMELEIRKYSFFEAIPQGIKMAGEQLKFYIDQFRLILSPETGAYKGVGGFKAMGNIFPADWNWEAFWRITAFFSIILAFMNMLPIPALDGGHVVFTLIEMITGRKPSQKFLEYAQVVGMVLLLGLMLYANGNDWFGWGKNR